MCIHTHVHTHSENMYYWNGIWKRSQIWVVSRYLFLSKMSVRCLVCKTLISHQMILHVWSSSKHPCLYSVHAKWLLDKTSHPREREESGVLPYVGLHRVRHDWSDLPAAAAAAAIKDPLVWSSCLRVILDRTKYDQASGTFWCGTNILGSFWTGPDMTKYQGRFDVEWLSLAYFEQDQVWPGIRDLLVCNKCLRVILERTKYD